MRIQHLGPSSFIVIHPRLAIDAYVGKQVIECFRVGRHKAERQEHVAPKRNAKIRRDGGDWSWQSTTHRFPIDGWISESNQENNDIAVTVNI